MKFMDERTFYYTLAVILGITINHFWAKFKNRMAVLKTTISHSYLGQTLEDPIFGSLQVLHNGIPIKILYLSRVTITNSSYRDLSNLEINIVCVSPSTRILISHGTNLNIHKGLEFTEQYANLLVQQRAEDLTYIWGRRDYKVPVLNRDDQLDIGLLVTNNDGAQPFLSVSCNSPGVKIEHVQVLTTFWGESQELCAKVGLIVSALIVALIIYFVDHKAIAVVLSAIIGLVGQVWGAIALKIYRVIVRSLS